MRIEAIGSIKSHGLVLSPGDIVTVPDDVGAELVARGWANDAAGVIPTGERKVLNARLVIGASAHGQAATVKGEKANG